MTPQELEDRLIQFAVDIILAFDLKEKTFAGEHLSKQIIRSSTSVALNYGEARGGSSNKDFIHKMRICLKELRETLINLKIQKSANLNNSPQIDKLLIENNELISIFVVSIRTSANKQSNS